MVLDSTNGHVGRSRDLDHHGLMLRLLGMFGLGVAFLVISPRLRTDVIDSITAASTQFSLSLAEYSPISYVAVGLVFIGGVMFLFRKAAAPR